MTQPFIEISELSKTFYIRRKALSAIRNISFSISAGETFGLVGESGCGKSTLGRTILRIYDPTSGSIRFQGRDITHLNSRKMKEFRREMQMIFQDPFASLNPRMTISDIIAEPLVVHRIGSSEERKKRILQLLDLVNLPQNCIHRFPHEFSGGQRQRIGIARALALDPKFIVCDEPLSSLDASIQAQIANLLISLQKDLKLTYLFIAHDLAMVQMLSKKIAVMYLGEFIESGSVDEIFQNPLHPYTKILLASVPFRDPIKERNRTQITLAGDLPSIAHLPKGCLFCNRCPKAKPICFSQKPPLQEIKKGHQVACLFASAY